MAQVTPTPRGIDIDIDEAALALHTPRLSRTLKNAAWELWMNRSATVGAVMILILLLVSVLAPVIATHDPVKQNYRERLQEKGIATEGFRPMGSAEGTMSVFAKRLKQGRSWSDNGLAKFIHVFVAIKDKLAIKTSNGKWTPTVETEEEQRQETKPPKHFVETLKDCAQEATRGNIAYLQQAIGKPIVAALKGLQGV